MLHDLWLHGQTWMGAAERERLLAIYGDSENVYEHCPDRRCRDLSTAERTQERCGSLAIGILRRTDPLYPARLAMIDDAPFLLFYKGIPAHACIDAVAVVGSRKATAYGTWAARALGERLACHDFEVVSGMAYGVDGSAHRGALEAGGRTAAVLGCGIDRCYPNAHRQLMEEIIDTGIVLSEYPPGTPPLPIHFPRRNRIISGMSRCVIIAEAGLDSGSLITADFALAQGRDVYAVPGNISSISSIGTNRLIKDGAWPLIRIDDILDDLGVPKKKTGGGGPALGRDERAVYEAIEVHGEMTLDQLCTHIGRTAGETRPIVSILEIKGIVEAVQGKIFIAK